MCRRFVYKWLNDFGLELGNDFELFEVDDFCLFLKWVNDFGLYMYVGGFVYVCRWVIMVCLEVGG